MTLCELIKYLKEGREIEFSVLNHSYFLAPQYDKNGEMDRYYICNAETNENIMTGSLSEVLDYEFSPQISFQSNIGSFCFEYIL